MSLPSDPELIGYLHSRRARALSLFGPNMAAIARACGFAATVKLIRARGGRRIQISRHKTARPTALSAIVGKAAAGTIGKLFGGLSIDVPTLTRLESIYRALRGEEMARQGEPAPAIARALAVTERMARVYRQRARELGEGRAAA
jgi:hypothetical protein